MKVTIVLSSGLPLCALEMPPLSFVRDLKSQLFDVFSHQMRIYLLLPAQLQPSAATNVPITQERYSLYQAICSKEIRLFTYKGEEMQDYQRVNESNQPIAILNPQSDLVIPSYKPNGRRDCVLFNLEEAQVCESGPGTDVSMVDLVIYSVQQGLFLCSIDLSASLSVLKTRLEAITSIPQSDIQLWHKGNLMPSANSLHSYSLSTHSRVILQPSYTTVAQITSSNGQSSVFPIRGGEGFDEIERIARILEKDWYKCKSCYEFTCISPVFPAVSRFFLVSMPSDLCVILHFKDGRSEIALIPAICTVNEAKRCIATQHGLPSTPISLSILEELPTNTPFENFGVTNNDKFTLIAKKPISTKKIAITVAYSDTQSSLFYCNSSDYIGDLKSQICRRKPTFRSKNIVLVKGTEVLQDSDTLVGCLIYEDMKLECGWRWDMRRKLENMRKMGFLRMEKREKVKEKGEFDTDLFETGRKPHWKPRNERIKLYQTELLQSLNVKIITSKEVYSLQIPSNTQLKAIKTHLSAKLPAQSYKIIYKGMELDETQTLAAQKVVPNSYLLLISPSELISTVVTPAGRCYSVVIEAQGNVAGLSKVLEQLTGLQLDCQRVFIVKCFDGGEQPFPVGIGNFALSLKLGSGGQFTLATPSGFRLGVVGKDSFDRPFPLFST